MRMDVSRPGSSHWSLLTCFTFSLSLSLALFSMSLFTFSLIYCYFHPFRRTEVPVLPLSSHLPALLSCLLPCLSISVQLPWLFSDLSFYSLTLFPTTPPPTHLPSNSLFFWLFCSSGLLLQSDHFSHLSLSELLTSTPAFPPAAAFGPITFFPHFSHSP